MRSDHDIDPFVPRRSLTGGHAMTLFGWGNPRYFPRLPQPTVRYFDVDHDARVLAHCHWQSQPWEHPTILLLHGLNASSDAHYIRGIATKAFTRGMNVVRLNQRNCGNTEHLSAGLFHSGLTADAKVVVNELSDIDGLTAISVAGYSLGGNLALKLAGEYGDRPPANRSRPSSRAARRKSASSRWPNSSMFPASRSSARCRPRCSRTFPLPA